jgi:H+-transporting ATPase
LTSDEAEKLLAKYGKNELPEKVEPKWLIFCKLLIQPMPIMIWLAAIIELGIGNYLDMGILLLIQFANASISFYETTKAGDAIAALKNSLRPSATVKRDDKWQNIDATLVVPGDMVLLASGSAIPADCRVNSGEIDVDQAALTGESLPVTMYKLDSCKMGSTVVRGETEATVEFTGAETFFGKTASLLQQTHEPSHLQKIIMTVMLVLVGLSLGLCIINFIYLLTQGQDVKEALTFTVVLLVASIPLAIEIVTTTTLAIGSKKLVASGAIVARLAAIEDLASMNILCSDKTGTLTLNQMMLQDDTPMFSEEKRTQEDILSSLLSRRSGKSRPVMLWIA